MADEIPGITGASVNAPAPVDPGTGNGASQLPALATAPDGPPPSSDSGYKAPLPEHEKRMLSAIMGGVRTEAMGDALSSVFLEQREDLRTASAESKQLQSAMDATKQALEDTRIALARAETTITSLKKDGTTRALVHRLGAGVIGIAGAAGGAATKFAYDKRLGMGLGLGLLGLALLVFGLGLLV